MGEPSEIQALFLPLSSRNYVVQLVIKISADEHFATTQKHFLTKLNETLVQIVKQDRICLLNFTIIKQNRQFLFVKFISGVQLFSTKTSKGKDMWHPGKTWEFSSQVAGSQTRDLPNLVAMEDALGGTTWFVGPSFEHIQMYDLTKVIYYIYCQSVCHRCQVKQNFGWSTRVTSFQASIY